MYTLTADLYCCVAETNTCEAMIFLLKKKVILSFTSNMVNYTVNLVAMKMSTLPSCLL